MEPKFRTSFIPKRTLKTESAKPKKNRAAMSLLVLIALVLFFGSIVLALTAFLYQGLLARGIEDRQGELERARAALDPSLLEELKRLDQRIESAKTILAEHTAPSQIFLFLEQVTLKSVRFRSLDYEAISSDNVTISMLGQAKSFAAVALQSDEFGKNTIIQNPVFSNLDLDELGNVVFNFTASINPQLLTYSKRVNFPQERTQLPPSASSPDVQNF